MNTQPTFAEIYLGEHNGSDRPDQRIRFAMHFALIAISVILLACGLAVWSGDWQRKRDTETMELASTQRDLSLRIAMQAVRHEPADDMEILKSMALAEANADELERLVGLGDEDRAQQVPARLSIAAYRAKNLRDTYFESIRNIVELPPGIKPSKAAVDLAHRKGIASVDAANALVVEIHRYFDHKIAVAGKTLLWLGFVAFLLIMALAFGLVEPTARIIQRSHRKLAKQVEEGRRLALVAERTNNVVVVTDAERRIVWVNDAFTRLNGYSLKEVLGSRPAHFLHSGLTDPATLAFLREKLDQQQPARAEVLNQAKNGRTYWVDVDIQPLHDEKGVLTGFIAVETDITDQVLQRERLRAVLNTLPAGVVEYTASTAAVVDCNDAASLVLGLTRDQMMGRSSIDSGWRAVREDLSPYPDDEHPIHRSLRTGQEFRGEMMGIITGSGDQRWLNVNTAPIRGTEGEITGAVACFVDVTEQRAQRMLLQMALHAANIGTWQWRIDGGEHDWSEASCKMLGFSVDEFREQLPTWRDRIHPLDLEKSDAVLREHLNDPTKPYVCEMRMRHREGHWVWVQVFGEVLERDATAEVQRMVGIHIDISDRKRHEDALVASAMSDALTGLPNRSNILNQIDRVISIKRKQTSRHFGLLFLDFDRFKQVNDSMGHAAGDELLRQISDRLRSALRPGDAVGRESQGVEQVAARLGGDEFVILLGELWSLSVC
jgi:PAS domain S-box-containing protein